MRRFLCLLAALLMAASPAYATIIPSIPYNLTNGSLADATQVMGNFNTIVSDVNTNGASSGANSDITSLTGLTTPLAPAYGGTVVFTGGTTTGAGDAQVLASVTPSVFGLTIGNIVTGIAGFTNTGAMTLNVSSSGATSVKVSNTFGLADPGAGAVHAGNYYVFIYDGTYWILVNPSTGAVPFTDAAALVANSADSTKLAKFSAASITTATTRTFTLPDADTTLVGTDATQTLSNKTLASGTIGTTQSPSDNSTKLATTAYADAAVAAAMTLGTPTSASGASVDFTSIPAGTKRIVVNFSGISTNGTSNPLIELGDSGGIETSGYLGAGSQLAGGATSANYTTGFGIPSAAAAATIHGSITLTLMDSSSFLWAASGTLGLSNGATTYTVGGSKALSAELDTVRITTVGGTDTFDAGTFNILYEK